MNKIWHITSIFLMILCLVFGILSILLKDADKTPIYILLAVVFWRIR
jgi:hypothetical protein